MLEQILAYLQNYFLVPNGVHSGTYTITDGQIPLPFLRKGQYFRIFGSVFNDGLHRYGDGMEFALADETFQGTIWALAIPRAVIDIANEIDVWKSQNVSDTPFVSESFGGYSYSRATNQRGKPVNWQDVFYDRLYPYRKQREYGAVASEASI